MNRRSVLNTAGFALLASIAGCVGSPADEVSSDSTGDANQRRPNSSDNNSGGTDDDISLAGEYEQCHLVAIQFEWLPEELQREVDAVMEEGAYSDERIGLIEAIDPDTSYLVIGETPHELLVDTDGDEKTLSLVEAEYMTAPEPRSITVENTDEREHELKLMLVDDEPLVDERVTVAGGEQTEIPATDRFGTFDLTARVVTGHESEEHFEYTIDDAHFDAVVTVTDETVSITQSVADIEPCDWQV